MSKTGMGAKEPSGDQEANMTERAVRAGACVIVGVLLAGILTTNSAAQVGPFSGGPTDYYETSDGSNIALSVVFPDNYDPSLTYPTVFEIAGYENGSASPDGRTIPGQTADELCSTDPALCGVEPPLADDSHTRTGAIRYAQDGYVVVHANLPGSGCSSGTFGLYSMEGAKAGYEVIEDWIVQQSWSNGKVGILGHSFSGITGFLVAVQAARAVEAGATRHVEAVALSGLIDDVYRGITFPGGVLNTLFPPLWYVGVRPGFELLGGVGQGVIRNAGDEDGIQCAMNQAGRGHSLQHDPIVQGVVSGGLDNAFWREHSLISYVDEIDVPVHISGTFQDQETGARGFTHLWEKVPDSVPKRLVVANGDHDTSVEADEMASDRKAWMDYWIRALAPDPSFGWSTTSGSVDPVSVRTLMELHPDASGEPVSNGHLDSASYPLEDTTWTDYYMCAGGTLTTDQSQCGAGSDTYFSGSRRQSWSYHAGHDVGGPVTTADGPDQILLRGPVAGQGEEWAMAGPIVAELYLSAFGNDTDLFVQVAAEDTTTEETFFLQRGWLKASHRAIDVTKSDQSDVDPARPGFLYRPWRPHTSPSNVSSGQRVRYLVEIWPVAHVIRPGQRLVVIISAPPAVDGAYSFAVPTSQPMSQNTLFYNDAQNPSRITLPVVPVDDITGLGATGPGCLDYWRVRCTTTP